MYFDTNYLIIAGIATVVSWIVQQRLMSTMKRLSKIPIRAGMSGADIANTMLNEHRINGVEVISVKGQLTDHYNPMNKTVNLSDWVYQPNSVAAAAVAAHEVGHAVQHATAYPMLQFRSGIVPIMGFANRFAPYVIMAGLIFISIPQILLAGIVLFGVSTLFAFITLPVEFDASRRALAWLETSNRLSPEEMAEARRGLRWAAMTYVVAALTSLATLMYYIWIFMGRRD